MAAHSIYPGGDGRSSSLVEEAVGSWSLVEEGAAEVHPGAKMDQGGQEVH